VALGALLASLSSVAGATAAAEDISNFAPARSFPAGERPSSVAIGDLNGDRRLDLAVANAGSDDVSVLLGKGNGRFHGGREFAAGDGPSSVAIGDLNGDEQLDLAVANQRSNDVSVLLGSGDGAFQAARGFRAGNGPSSVAIGDLNGDERLDLAVATRRSDDVAVLLGNGDGSFQTARRFRAGDSPRSVAIGDVNGDGRLDLAVANGPSADSRDVSVLLGRGDGSFRLRVRYDAGAFPAFSVAIDDLNGDGTLDLAVAGGYYFTQVCHGFVSVLLGNGDASFQAPRTFQVAGCATSVAIGDLNGDDRLDLAVAAWYGSNVNVLLGNGDGSFGGLRYFDAGDASVAIGDLNRDHRPDLAVADSGGKVYVLLNTTRSGGP
jgi:hypothetical protein